MRPAGIRVRNWSFVRDTGLNPSLEGDEMIENVLTDSPELIFCRLLAWSEYAARSVLLLLLLFLSRRGLLDLDREGLRLLRWWSRDLDLERDRERERLLLELERGMFRIAWSAKMGKRLDRRKWNNLGRWLRCCWTEKALNDWGTKRRNFWASFQKCLPRTPWEENWSRDLQEFWANPRGGLEIRSPTVRLARASFNAVCFWN